MIPLAIVVTMLLTGGVTAISRTLGFDRDQAGGMAAGWKDVTGTWRIVAEPTAPSSGQVLAQVSSEHRGSYFNLAVVDEPVLRDVALSVKYRAVAGREDQGGGPVWRYRDTRNYYIARENPLERNIRVYRVVNGRRIQLGSANTSVRGGSWHTLKVTMTGNHIQCFLDGKRYLDVKDDTFPGAGKVGLWTKADAHTQFDDFTVTGE